MKFKLNHLYHYTHRTGHGRYPYFIRICTKDEPHYLFEYYNLKTATKGCSEVEVSKTHTDFMLEFPPRAIRELTKSEKAKSLLIEI